MLLLAAERRLPQRVRRHGRVVARRLGQAAMVAFVCLVVLVVAGAWAAVEVDSARCSAPSPEPRPAYSARRDLVLAQVLEVERPQHLGDLALAGVGDVVGVGAEAQDVGLGLVQLARRGLGGREVLHQPVEEAHVEVALRVADREVVELGR